MTRAPHPSHPRMFEPRRRVGAGHPWRAGHGPRLHRRRSAAVPPGAAAVNDAERMRILELLEQGKITAAEAAELLSALGDRPRDNGRRERSRWGPAEQPFDRPRWLKVRVTDAGTGRTRANVTIPIRVLGFGVGFAHRLNVPGSRHIDDIMEAVRAGRRGTIFDVSGDGDERVEIIIE